MEGCLLIFCSPAPVGSSAKANTTVQFLIPPNDSGERLHDAIANPLLPRERSRRRKSDTATNLHFQKESAQLTPQKAEKKQVPLPELFGWPTDQMYSFEGCLLIAPDSAVAGNAGTTASCQFLPASRPNRCMTRFGKNAA